MTEKIIIDGVDVSGCEYLECGMCTAERNCDGYTDWECTDPETANCYYKQLQRTTAQYKAVVEQNKSLQVENITVKKKNQELFNKAVEARKETDDVFNRLQAELKTKEQECEELKESVMKQCPICGEKFLSPIGMELYDTNNRYKQALVPFEDEYFKDLDTKTIAELAKKSIRLTKENSELLYALDEIKDICCAKNKNCHIGCFICSTKCNENKILAIINEAKAGE